jgi:hypothetical protein
VAEVIRPWFTGLVRHRITGDLPLGDSKVALAWEALYHIRLFTFETFGPTPDALIRRSCIVSQRRLHKNPGILWWPPFIQTSRDFVEKGRPAPDFVKY